MKNLIAILFLYVFSSAIYAGECYANHIPKSLYKLIAAKKYDEAIQQAKNAVVHSKDKKKAETILAYVYVNATLQPGLSIDLNKLGFKSGEKGSKSVTPSQVFSAMHDRLVVSPKYLSDAEKQIQSVIDRWEDNKNLYYCLTKIYFYKPDHKRFLEYLEKTAYSFKDDKKEAVDFLITYAGDYYKKNQFDLAGDVYVTLLKVFPKSVPVLSSLGVTYIARGFTENAKQYFEDAYKYNPKDLIVIGNIAEVAMLMGDFERADKFLQMKADGSSKKAPVYFDLAMNAMYKGPKNSLHYWDEYFKENQKSPDEQYWQNNAKIIQKGAMSNASDDDWINLAAQMIQINVPKYAIPILSYINVQRPYDAGISYQMAHAYDVGKYYDLEEKSLLVTLVRLKNPKNNFVTSVDNVYYNLSRCAYSLGRLNDSKQYLDKISLKSKKLSNIEYMYALYYRDTDNKKIAEEYLNSCLQHANKDEFHSLCKNVLTEIVKK